MNDIIIITNQGTSMSLSGGAVFSTFIVTAVTILAFYILRSVGVYTLAKNNGVKYPFLAFVPFIWTYPASKLIGEVIFFGKKMKNFALIFTLIFAVSNALTLTVYFMQFFPLIGYYLSGGQVYYVTYPAIAEEGSEISQYLLGGGFFVGNDIVYPYYNISRVITALNVMIRISNVLDIVNVIFTLTFYVMLFRKFWPEHFFVGIIFSIFGLFAPFVFAIRNNKPVNYFEYMRRKHNASYGNNGFTYPNGEPYTGDFKEKKDSENNYGDSNNGDNNDDPFEEFSNKHRR